MGFRRISIWCSSRLLYSIYIFYGLFHIYVSSYSCNNGFYFGAIKSNFEDNYDNVIFITGFIGNAILAILLTYIGEKLGVSLYYVAVLVFGMRLFNNLSIIRRYIINNIINKNVKIKEHLIYT